MNTDKRPVGVTIYAVLFYISGVALFIVGILGLIFGVEFIHQFGRFSGLGGVGRIGGEVIVLIALFILIFSAFEIFIGTGLLQLKNWARITVIILTIFSALSALIGIVVYAQFLSITTIPFVISLLQLLVQILIIVYFNLPKVVESFTGRREHSINDYTRGEKQKYNNMQRGKDEGSSFFYVFIKDGMNKKIKLQEGTNYIGRSVECNIVLPDREKRVSRRHAAIYVKNGMAGIKSMSKNSTRVNGQRIDRIVLRDGDVITLGNKTIEFRVSSMN